MPPRRFHSCWVHHVQAAQMGPVGTKASPPLEVVDRRGGAVWAAPKCACPLARDDAFLAGMYKLYSRQCRCIFAAPFVPSSTTRRRISSWRWSASSNCSVRRHARQYVRTCPHVPACVDTARVRDALPAMYTNIASCIVDLSSSVLRLTLPTPALPSLPLQRTARCTQGQ